MWETAQSSQIGERREASGGGSSSMFPQKIFKKLVKLVYSQSYL